MKVRLPTGGEIDLPSKAAIDEKIKEMESFLRKLRRLRDLADEFEPEKNGAPAAEPTKEVAK